MDRRRGALAPDCRSRCGRWPGENSPRSTEWAICASLPCRPAIELSGCGAIVPGTSSIRVNDQYRICFSWEQGYADNVAIEDYH